MPEPARTPQPDTLTVTITDPEVVARVREAARYWDSTPDWVVERTLLASAARAEPPPDPHPRKPRVRVTPEMEATIRRLRDEGRTFEEIGEAVGVHGTTAFRYAKNRPADA